MFKKAGTKIFVDLTGQEDNLGDVILRRSFLRGIKAEGQLHALVGRHSADYLRGLSSGDAVRYARKRDWLLALLRSALSHPTVYFEKPGEVQPQRWGLKQSLAMTMVVALVRLLGGASFCLGVGLRSVPAGPGRMRARLMLRPFRMLAWRDSNSAQELGIGEVMPDWAFGEASVHDPAPPTQRTKLVVSMRDDRPYPTQEWLGGLRAWAGKNRLEVMTIWQVGRDRLKAERLAGDLGGNCLSVDHTDYLRWERELRAAYGQARVVVSDRLHVLIVAAMEGAAPVCICEWPEEKVERHFSAIGFDGVSHALSPETVGGIPSLLDAQLARRAELADRLAAARGDIRGVSQRVAKMMPRGI